jgi:hypothetical protein
LSRSSQAASRRGMAPSGTQRARSASLEARRLNVSLRSSHSSSYSRPSSAVSRLRVQSPPRPWLGASREELRPKCQAPTRRSSNHHQRSQGRGSSSTSDLNKKRQSKQYVLKLEEELARMRSENDLLRRALADAHLLP